MKEIKLRCKTIGSTLGIDPANLPDSQLLEINKGLGQLNADFSRILNKVTEYAGSVGELGVSKHFRQQDGPIEHPIGLEQESIAYSKRKK